MNTAGLINEYFAELMCDKWQSSQTDKNRWRAVCGGFEAFPIDVSLSANWIYAGTLMDIPPEKSNFSILWHNSRLLMAKLYKDAQNRTILGAQWPTNHLTFSAFKLLLTTITQALQSLYRDEDAGTEQQANQMLLYIPQERIWQYLYQINVSGWILADSPQDSCWHFGYRGHRGEPDSVYMHFTAHWTHFQSPIRIRELPHLEAICDYLLHLNRYMIMAKFRLSGQGNIMLTIQCPTEQLDFPLFNVCMQGMATYLDRFSQEVILLANSERLEEFLKSGDLLPPKVVVFDW